MSDEIFVRKNVRKILKDEKEKSELIKAFIRLKETGKYDRYVIWHAQTMGTMVQITGEDTRRNAAHWGPIFLPWHREFLHKFELDLGVALPYWDWTEDVLNPMASPIWRDDFMGGNGNPANDYVVFKGPFGSEQLKWPTIEANDYGNPVGNTELNANPNIPLSDYTNGSLTRFFTLCYLEPRCAGTGGVNPGLPKSIDVDNALATSPYDSSPWDDSSSQSQSFRMRLENRPHGGVHIWVGGHMLTNTSPNDPLFFLHHSNIDRIWVEWQNDISRRTEPQKWYPPHGTITFPDGSIIHGHNRNDHMTPWGTNGNNIEMVLNHHNLKYKYE